MFIRILCGIISFALPLLALDSFDLHNINEAHAMGYSGYGVNVGIADTKFNPNHNALQGQFIYTDKNQYTSAYTASQNAHGSNVAGVIGANYTDGKYFGVAYGAKLAGFGEFGNSVRSGASNNFILNNDIRIINNSWAYTNYNQYYREFENLVINHKVLIVFASGNYAKTSPSYPANNPKHNEALQSWLTVGNLDSHYISRDNSGNLVVASRGVATSSNLCLGSFRFCVMASGTSIRTTDGNSNDKFSSVTGTSFSAPLVSGVAALVQEKFPFMNGKQLADVILSTANRNFIAPKLIIKGDTLIYIDSEVPTDSTKIRADVIAAYGYVRNYTSTMKATKEEVFGQGIVDATKALGGISLIDINRLNNNDVIDYKGIKEAFWEIDLGNHDATFSNDISQRKWDDKYHDTNALNRPTQLDNLNAGLLKKGSGTLTITGNLDYLGTTIIRSGNLALNQTLNRTNLSVAGNIYVESNGSLRTYGDINLKKNLFLEQGGFSLQRGKTTIEQNLNNTNGQIALNSGSTLDIKGAYTQSGANSSLMLGFTQNDIENKHTMLTSTKYDIKSGNLIYNPQITSFKNTTLQIPLEESLLNQMSKFSNITLANHSLVLDYELSSDKKSIIVTTKDDAYENFQGANKRMARALRNIAAQSIDEQHTEFFTMLNSAPLKTYTNTIKSLDNNSHLIHTAHILNKQNTNNLRQFLSTQNAYYQGGRFSLTPYYSYSTGLNGEHLTSHFIGGNVALDVSYNNTAIGGFVSYGKYDSAFENANLNAHTLQGGINIISDFSSFKILANISIGGSFNKLNRNLAEYDANFDAKYNNLFTNANLGVGYDIKSKDFSSIFTPQALINYGFTYQSAFKENGEVLPMQYNAMKHNALSLLIGGKFTQTFLANKSFLVGIYGFYERKLLGEKFKNNAYFIADKEHLPQTYTMPQNSGIVGFNIGYNGETFFVTMNLDAYINPNNINIGGNVEFGFKFGGAKQTQISTKRVKLRQVSSLDSNNLQDSIKSQVATQSTKAQRPRKAQSLKPQTITFKEYERRNNE